VKVKIIANNQEEDKEYKEYYDRAIGEIFEVIRGNKGGNIEIPFPAYDGETTSWWDPDEYEEIADEKPESTA